VRTLRGHKSAITALHAGTRSELGDLGDADEVGYFVQRVHRGHAQALGPLHARERVPGHLHRPHGVSTVQECLCTLTHGISTVLPLFPHTGSVQYCLRLLPHTGDQDSTAFVSSHQGPVPFL